MSPMEGTPPQDEFEKTHLSGLERSGEEILAKAKIALQEKYQEAMNRARREAMSVLRKYRDNLSKPVGGADPKEVARIALEYLVTDMEKITKNLSEEMGLKK